MPLDSSAFPEEVQVAFFVFGLLPDRWDGMSGTYLGKEWSSLEHIFKIYDLEDVKTILFFAKLYEGIVVNHKAEEAENRRKAEQRKTKAAGGGKTYTHNVRG
jgi:hypothetical protein